MEIRSRKSAASGDKSEASFSWWQALTGHALDTYPNECCGALVVRGDLLQAVAFDNHAADPRRGFVLDPLALLSLCRRLADDGSVIAIYHSHVDRDAFLSVGDQRLAMVVAQLVVSVRHGVVAERRWYRKRASGWFQVEPGAVIARGRLDSREAGRLAR